MRLLLNAPTERSLSEVRSHSTMEEPIEDLEPLFNYAPLQPFDPSSLDDDELSPAFPSKRQKASFVEKQSKNGKQIPIIDCEDKDEDDWLPPPSKVSVDAHNRVENSTLKALRVRKQELLSYTQSAKEALQTVEESVKKDLSASLQSLDGGSEASLKPLSDNSKRAKIILSIQDKDGLKQFRVYMDDKFEKLFKIYADKVKLDMKKLAFCFDGDKISPIVTPDDLGMEDNDIIEVHVKS